MKRKSLKLDEIDWNVLAGIAADCGCEYRGEASWRRLIDWVASGKLTVLDRPDKRIQAFQEKLRQPLREQASAKMDALMGHDLLRQEQKRRAAGVGPRGVQAALARELGYPNAFETLVTPREETP